jgi:hypothetical protein
MLKCALEQNVSLFHVFFSMVVQVLVFAAMIAEY